ncbi:MAG: hypothetical protein JXR96_14750 [Deltaproteobacteria bacterium]|nr:hypothetical protein [Deltaproteobacteria bacterium]
MLAALISISSAGCGLCPWAVARGEAMDCEPDVLGDLTGRYCRLHLLTPQRHSLGLALRVERDCRIALPAEASGLGVRRLMIEQSQSFQQAELVIELERADLPDEPLRCCVKLRQLMLSEGTRSFLFDCDSNAGQTSVEMELVE